MDNSLNAYIKEEFNTGDKDLRTYSGLELAYIGDSVFDIIVRTILVNKKATAVNKLHTTASSIVNARCQAAMMQAILDMLSDEEMSVYRRGRNSKPHTKAKNASIGEYMEATGFEALLGFLYLKDDMSRIFELVKAGFEAGEIEL